MDLASSPYRHNDDIDLELEQDDDFLADPHPESMFDDPPAEDDIDIGEDADEKLDVETRDDDMIEEEPTMGEAETSTQGMTAEAQHEPEQGDSHFDEDDVLYEDEDDENTPEELDQTGITQIEPQDDHFAENDLQSSALSHQAADEAASGETTSFPPQNDQVAESDQTFQADRHLIQVEETGAGNEDQGTLNEDYDHSQERQHSRNLGIQDEKPESHDATDPGQERTQQTDAAAQQIDYIHPVKVIYQESEICLFPPTADDSSDTFFLPDISLAYETLDRLLAACREVLADTIVEHDELVLDIASLGLHICEVRC